MTPEDHLKTALFHGHHYEIEMLLDANPGLGRSNFGLMCALYDFDGVKAALDEDPGLATRAIGPRTPILHLAFSRYLHGKGNEESMVAVGRALIAAGANPSDAYEAHPGSGHELSALYGAVGHADNPILARLLLEAGANPDDNESLYHSTEMPHSHSLRLLLEFGANPKGTNALLRALDFNNSEMVAMLLAGGADPNEMAAEHVSGEPTTTLPALHQAARRMCGAEVTELLIAAGADKSARFQGITAYALARVHGNSAVAQALVDAGADQDLTDPETFLVAAAEGSSLPDDHVDVGGLADEYQKLLCRLAARDGALGHIRRLVALGFDPDLVDEMSLPPVHLAGWEGNADHLAYFLSFAPDTEDKNGYGGTLLSTVIHGASNAGEKDGQDHHRCVELVLEAGAEILPGMRSFPMPAGLREILVREEENRP